MFGGWRTQNAPGPLGRWTELCAMFAAIPAPILLGIIPRCAGKAQRGGRVGWAGDLLPLCRLRLPFTSPSGLVHGFSPHREGVSALILSCGVLGPPPPFSFWRFGLFQRSSLNAASVAGEGITPRRNSLREGARATSLPLQLNPNFRRRLPGLHAQHSRHHRQHSLHHHQRLPRLICV